MLQNFNEIPKKYRVNRTYFFFLCFLVTILVFIHRYYSMMMVRVKCGTGRSSGSRIRRIRGSTAVRFLIFLAVPGSGFCVSAIIPGPSPMRVWWQTGTLYNRAGVAPVRLNTVYALNRLHPTGLEPGLPALYLAELTSLALHTVFPLRADKRVGSPA